MLTFLTDLLLWFGSVHVGLITLPKLMFASLAVVGLAYSLILLDQRRTDLRIFRSWTGSVRGGPRDIIAHGNVRRMYVQCLLFVGLVAVAAISVSAPMPTSPEAIVRSTIFSLVIIGIEFIMTWSAVREQQEGLLFIKILRELEHLRGQKRNGGTRAMDRMDEDTPVHSVPEQTDGSTPQGQH